MPLAEVAERLAVPVQTFYDWRKHGRGPKGYRLGNRIFFRWSEVDDWLQQHRECDRAAQLSALPHRRRSAS